MKRLARELDPTRPVTEAMNNAWGRGLSVGVDVNGVIDVVGCNYAGPQSARRLPRGTSDAARRGHREREHGLDARHLRERRARGLRERLRPNIPPGRRRPRTGGRFYGARPWVGGRFRVDRLRLPRRAHAVQLAVHQLALRHHRHVRLPEGHLLLLPGVVERQTGAAPVPALELAGKEGQDVEVWCFTNARSRRALRQRHERRRARGEAELARRVESALRGRRDRSTRLQGRPARSSSIGARRPARQPKSCSSRSRADLRRRRGSLGRRRADRRQPGPRGADGGRRGDVHGQRARARVIGVGNGDPSSHEPDRASKRNAFNGLCMALVQSQKTPGEIRVDASAPGLASATATLTASATTPRPTL